MAYDASREDRFTRDPDATGDRTGAGRPRRHDTNTGWYWLFVLPFVFTLLPFIYNRTSPELIGVPFFYWYQTAWIVVTAVIVYVVYMKTRGA
jgi:Protein of unknown function (DUF3311)